MPTYEHKCRECSHQWELIYGMSDDPPTICPKCKEENVYRMISAPGAVKVRLEGKELVKQLWKEGKDLAHKAKTNENLANELYGVTKFGDA